MASLLFLTADEQSKVFAKLPAEIQEEWLGSVREEIIDAYESTKELQKRIADSGLDKHPALQLLAEAVSKKLQAGGSIDDVSIKGVPSDFIPDFLYAIGACGISALLQMMLQSPKLKAKDMESIAALSRARHRILQINTVLA